MNDRTIAVIILLLSILIIGTSSLALINSTDDSFSSVNQDLDVQLEIAFPNLSFTRSVDLQHAGDGTNRIFIVEQAGVIRVFDNDASVSASIMFLDIKDRVSDAGNEEGLLGLTFHPDFENNGFFYVYYSASSPRRSVIARYNMSATDPDQADRNSELVLLEVKQPYSNHNGGQLAFGPDGYLYVALGDGGSGGDPLGHSQNRSTLLGSILRIDVDSPADGNYGIPDDNPFTGNSEGYKEEIFAYGLRNPWRFSFDPVTGWLWAGDVGQNLIEEIDIIESGKNYGWNIMEGNSCYSPSTGCDTTGFTLPVIDYTRDLGSSVTGGYVYRGTEVPDLVGLYIYGDFVTGRIWSLNYNGVNVASNAELLKTSLNIASFGVDENNELYVCAFDGKIYKFTASTTGTSSTSSTTGTISTGTSDTALTSTVETAPSEPGNLFSPGFGVELLIIIPFVYYLFRKRRSG